MFPPLGFGIIISIPENLTEAAEPLFICLF